MKKSGIAAIATAATLVTLLTGCAQPGEPQRIQHDGGEIRIGEGIGLYPGEGAAIITSKAGVRIANLPTMREAEAGVPANTLYIDPQGFVYRVTP